MPQQQTASDPTIALIPALKSSYADMVEKLNVGWHERALQIFLAIVLAHWAEHLVQAYQIWGLGWPIPESRGVLGYWFPWMVSSELLHYGYALIMLIGLWILRTGFTSSAYTWWMVSFWIQFWHHIEHGLLQGQAIVGENLANSPVPVSILQFVIPRVELHLIYNTAVFIPMIIAMYLHMFPPPGEEQHIKCSCVVQPKSSSNSS
ncbi:hypothetical protein LQ318_02815 [Aliifodinibius salicampi]|uniref:Uncharacterized protein n=1 Tax=Fodinibius salicampi TaxID=1920655 RepID=A0ABT3PVJ8_9BACT|nr:hypothetical protein [Fodinibius salicampi]MCW9711826.1 hypothetical protein [Fodinibius salicampi]